MSTEVRMPQLTQTMTEATIARWLKSEGETVISGEPLLEVVTDKATMEVEAPVGGVLARIVMPEGEIPVGTTIGVIAGDGEALGEPSPVAGHAAGPGAKATPVVESGSPPAAPTRAGQPAAASARLRVSPLAKRIAAEHGVDLALVSRTGPGGLITEADVRQYLEAGRVTLGQSTTFPPAEPGERAKGHVHAGPAALPMQPVRSPFLPTEEEETIPLRGVRKTIAERLALSRRTAADVTTVAEVDMTEVSALREHVDITYTAFVARATAMALTEFPILNSRLENDRIVLGKRVHLGVAVAIDEGLKVPVIRDAQAKSLRQIGVELAEKAQRGAEGKLSPEELTGSSFTVTNSGVFGSLLFTPIINPPESGILGMGKIVKTAVVRDDQVVIRKMMYLCLTYDHRVVDGAPAVKFLQRVKALLEKPQLLI